MAAWSLGRLGPYAYKAVSKLVELLRDGYWKVRTAACEAIGQLGNQA